MAAELKVAGLSKKPLFIYNPSLKFLFSNKILLIAASSLPLLPAGSASKSEAQH